MNLLAENVTTVVLGLVIGIVVALVLFGLIFLISVLPAIKAKKQSKAEAKEPASESAQNAEQPVEGTEDEPAEEKAEEPAEEVTEEAAEEPAEEPVEEKAEEPAEQKAEKEVAAVAAVEDDEEEEEDDVEDNETETEKEERIAAINSAPELKANQRYNRSYIARLTQSGDTIKSWYSRIKNALSSYKKVKCTASWRQEKFVSGGETVAKIALRGKTLCVYYALDVKHIKNAEVEDVSGGAHSATPALIRIKKEQLLEEALRLVKELAAKYSLEEGTARKTDYTKVYALKTTEQLLQEGQVKIITVRVK